MYKRNDLSIDMQKYVRKRDYCEKCVFFFLANEVCVKKIKKTQENTYIGRDYIPGFLTNIMIDFKDYSLKIF